ncbi:hypothetical protein Hypma_002177 [Hypsizygus marmoreus]|uniref:Uncharacterized protein n=1 Tax=Hypsizygus marmoreus TaxID=39966 RepID=A0A369K565_HYPMA|nr:hypothetical protein Hypma_002177 [Hypsizygus marmoreus]
MQAHLLRPCLAFRREDTMIDGAIGVTVPIRPVCVDRVSDFVSSASYEAGPSGWGYDTSPSTNVFLRWLPYVYFVGQTRTSHRNISTSPSMFTNSFHVPSLSYISMDTPPSTDLLVL